MHKIHSYKLIKAYSIAATSISIVVILYSLLHLLVLNSPPLISDAILAITLSFFIFNFLEGLIVTIIWIVKKEEKYGAMFVWAILNQIAIGAALLISTIAGLTYYP